MLAYYLDLAKCKLGKMIFKCLIKLAGQVANHIMALKNPAADSKNICFKYVFFWSIYWIKDKMSLFIPVFSPDNAFLSLPNMGWATVIAVLVNCSNAQL